MLSFLKRKALLLTTACLFFAAAHYASAALDFYDGFNYNAGTLTSQGPSWTAHSGGGTNPIQVLDTTGDSGKSLSYPGLASSEGRRIQILKVAGEDVGRDFNSPVTGEGNEVYGSFLMKVTGTVGSSSLFAHFHQGTGATNFWGRIWIQAAGSGFNLGLSRSGNTPTYGATEYSLNTTYLVVLRYRIVAGTTNDIVELYVNPTPGAAMPGTATVTYSGSDTDVSVTTGIGRIGFRQNSTTAGAEVQIDEVRVGTAWSDVTPAASATATPSPSPTETATPTPTDTETPTPTETETPTPTPSETASPTPTDTETPTPTPTETETPTPTETATPPPTDTETPTPTPTETETPTPTPSETPSPTPSDTPTPTETETPTPTATETPTPTETETPTPTPSETASPTPSDTATPTETETPTPTPSETASPTPSETPSPTPSETPSPTPSETPEPTPLEPPTSVRDWLFLW
jgi:hypothetical protein